MKVVHLAPVWLPVSHDSSGGVETLLAQLLAEQQRRGHDVLLVAAGGSAVDVPLLEAVPEALVPVMARGEAGDYAYAEAEAVGACARAAAGADVVHSHVVPGGFVLDDALRAGPPVLHTLHGQVTQDLVTSLKRRERAVVTVSRAQAELVEQAGSHVFGVCHNGIDVAGLPFCADGGEDLLFLGRMEPQKGPDLAVDAARAAGRRLVLAGPKTDRTFFDAQVQPRLAEDAVYVGVLGHEAKHAALRRSAALLVPSRWAEPFGMVSVEAMAAGTPVVALAAGALPEVVDDGVTGVVVRRPEDLPGAVARAARLDRAGVRARGEERFAIGAVADRYDALYSRLRGSA